MRASLSAVLVAASAGGDDRALPVPGLAGFEVDVPIEWGWLEPHVSTAVVHDNATGRVVTVFVFQDTAATDVFRGQMAAHLISVVVIVGTHIARASPPHHWVVRVIDDGANGGPAILSTQIVPVR